MCPQKFPPPPPLSICQSSNLLMLSRPVSVSNSQGSSQCFVFFWPWPRQPGSPPLSIYHRHLKHHRLRWSCQYSWIQVILNKSLLQELWDLDIDIGLFILCPQLSDQNIKNITDKYYCIEKVILRMILLFLGLWFQSWSVSLFPMKILMLWWLPQCSGSGSPSPGPPGWSPGSGESRSVTSLNFRTLLPI